MGSGKGNPERWVAVVRPGRIMFELSYPDEEIARGALNRAIQKLPIKAQDRQPRGDVLMAKLVARPRRRRAARPARRGEGPPVQPAVQAGHRPARELRPPRRPRRTSPASSPSCGPVRSPPPRRLPEVRRDERDRPTTPERNARKVREGIVTSNKMDKTAVVTVTERVRHKRYNKTMQRDKKLYVHDENNDLQRRRPRPHHGDPPAVQAQALAGRRSPGACPMIQQETRLRVADNSGAREVLVHQGARRLASVATPRSATSSSPPSRTPCRVPRSRRATSSSASSSG